MSSYNSCMDSKAQAAYRALLEYPAKFPAAFTYGGKRYEGFGHLPLLSHSTQAGTEKVCDTLVFELEKGVHLRAELAYWPQWGAREWTLWFENNSSSNSAVLEEVTEATLELTGADPVLKGILGDHENLYRPYEKPLKEGRVDFVSDFGRPTHIYFPYFNLECGDGGCLLALGWGGTWKAGFEATAQGAAVTFGSTNGLATYLKPGEKVRTALVAVLPYTGRSEAEVTNLWRGWYLACNMPKADGSGRALQPFSTCCLSCDTGLPNSDGSISERDYTWKPSLEKMAAEGVHVDYRWVDAGWYTDPNGNTVPSDWAFTIGTWELDRAKWPGNSFRESTDYARAHNMKTLVWFEPERVTHPQELQKNYGYNAAWALDTGEGFFTNNIGDPACLEWTTQRILKMMGEEGVEMYREDNNSDSAGGWRLGDRLEGEHRTGITENKAVTAHYAMWDAIIAFGAAHGGDTFVDSCASGGGRNDLESMRRGIPMLRSDNDRTSSSLRLSMTTSFDKWLPFCGASTVERKEQLDTDGVRDPYVWRASYLPALHVSACWVQNPDTDFEDIRRGIREWDTVKNYLLKDFYVLTPWHPEEDRTGWTAFAYHDAAENAGVLQAFRMEDCVEAEYTVQLPFAETQEYILRCADTGTEYRTQNGRFTLRLETPRSAALFYLRKA